MFKYDNHHEYIVSMHWESFVIGFGLIMWWFHYCKLTLCNFVKITLLRNFQNLSYEHVKIMLSQGSPNVTWPTWGKKLQKINNQILYHQDPMCWADGFLDCRGRWCPNWRNQAADIFKGWQEVHESFIDGPIQSKLVWVK